MKKRSPRVAAERLVPSGEGFRSSLEKTIKLLAPGQVEAARRRYMATGNPLFAWDAYRVARRGDRPTPDWVTSYLDHVAEALLDPAAASEPAARASAKALDLDIGKGESTPFADYHSLEFDYALLVQICINHGYGIDSALEAVSAELEVAKNTARKAYDHYRSFWQEN